jgi:hypothetical protein
MYSVDLSTLESRRRGALSIGVDEAGVHTVVPCSKVPDNLRTLLRLAGFSLEASTDSELRIFPHPSGEIVDVIADALQGDVIDKRPTGIPYYSQNDAVPSLRARVGILPIGQIVFPRHSAEAA